MKYYLLYQFSSLLAAVKWEHGRRVAAWSGYDHRCMSSYSSYQSFLVMGLKKLRLEILLCQVTHP